MARFDGSFDVDRMILRTPHMDLGSSILAREYSFEQRKVWVELEKLENKTPTPDELSWIGRALEEIKVYADNPTLLPSDADRKVFKEDFQKRLENLITKYSQPLTLNTEANRSSEIEGFTPKNNFQKALLRMGCPVEIIRDPNRAREQRSYFWTKFTFGMRHPMSLKGFKMAWETLDINIGEAAPIHVDKLVEEVDQTVQGQSMTRDEQEKYAALRKDMKEDLAAFDILFKKTSELLAASFNSENLYKFFEAGSNNGSFFDDWFWDSVKNLPELYVIDETGQIMVGKDEKLILDERTLNVRLFQMLRDELKKGRRLDPQNRVIYDQYDPVNIGDIESRMRMARMFYRDQDGKVTYKRRKLKGKLTPPEGMLPLDNAKGDYSTRERNFREMLARNKSNKVVAAETDATATKSGRKVIDWASEFPGYLSLGLTDLSLEQFFEDCYCPPDSRVILGRPVGVTFLARQMNGLYPYKFLTAGGQVNEGEMEADSVTSGGRPNPGVVGMHTYGMTFFDYFGYDGRTLTQHILEAKDDVGFEAIKWERLPKNATVRWCEAMKNMTATYIAQHDGFKSGTLDTIVKLEIEKDRAAVNVPWNREWLDAFRKLIGYHMITDMSKIQIVEAGGYESGPPTGDFVKVVVQGRNEVGSVVQRSYNTRMFTVNNWNEGLIARWVDLNREADGKTATTKWQMMTYSGLLGEGYKEDHILLTDQEIQEKAKAFPDVNAAVLRLTEIRNTLKQDRTDEELIANGATKQEIQTVRKIDFPICTIDTRKKVKEIDELVDPKSLLERQKVTEVVYGGNSEGDAIARITSDHVLVLGMAFCPEALRKFTEGYHKGPLNQLQLKITRKVPFFGKFFEIEDPRVQGTNTFPSYDLFLEFMQAIGRKVTKEDYEKITQLINLGGVVSGGGGSKH